MTLEQTTQVAGEARLASSSDCVTEHCTRCCYRALLRDGLTKSPRTRCVNPACNAPLRFGRGTQLPPRTVALVRLADAPPRVQVQR